MEKIILVFLAFTIGKACLAQDFQYRKISPFSKIAVWGNIEISIEKGSQDSIRLEGDKETLDKVTVKNDDNALIISVTDKIFSKSRAVKIFLKISQIERLQAKGGSEINSPEKLKTDDIEIVAESGSTVNFKLETNTIHAVAVEGSTISLEGISKSLIVENTTGAIFNGYEFKCDTIIAKTNTGGLAKIYPLTKLDASAATGGQISYRGEPAIKKEKTILGGTIEQTAE